MTGVKMTEINDTQLFRSSLYTGGTSPKRMIQAAFFSEDCIVYDLEDSVSEGEKDAARFLVACLLRDQRPCDKRVVVRVNGLYSNYFAEDLEAIVRAKPDAIRIPKVEYAEEVRRVDHIISEIEHKAGIPEGSVKIWCNIESYEGVLNAGEIAKASSRIEALALGAEDFTQSMHGKRTKDGWEIFYARNAVLMACREAGVSAQDAVFSDFNDTEGLKKDLEMASSLGFDGKTTIHPMQIKIVNRYFTPSEKEIRKAQQIISCLQKAEENHSGVCSLNGEMIDLPVKKRALQILARAKASGALREEGEK